MRTSRFACGRGGVVSWQAMEWVLKHSRSKGASRLVALAIAYHIDKDGKPGFPSAETIAGYANIRRASVFPCLDVLHDLGELDWIPGGGYKRTNLYTLKLFALQASLFEGGNSQQNGLKAAGKTVRSTGRNSQNYARKQSERPDTNRSEPALEPARGRNSTFSQDSSTVAVGTEVRKNGWVNRDEERKRGTAEALNRIFPEPEALAGDVRRDVPAKQLVKRVAS